MIWSAAVVVFGFLVKFVTHGALSAIVNAFASVDREKYSFLTQAFVAAAGAEVNMRATVASERSALWLSSPTYRLLTLLIVGPPAVHMALIFANTSLAPWIGSWGIPAAPAPYDVLEGAICGGFVGVTTVGGSIVATVRRVLK